MHEIASLNNDPSIETRSLNTTGEHSLTPVLQELERMFQLFAPMFQTPMPMPVITVQAAGRKRAYGWFSGRTWQNSDPSAMLPEINMTAETMRREPAGIASTLIHEMVHYANFLRGIHDCSANQYHNRKFKERAESVGLMVGRHVSRGWATTALSPELWHTIQRLDISWDAFAIARRMANAAKAGSRMKKWKCDCTTLRCATQVDAVCNRCGERFVFQDKVITPATISGLNDESENAPTR